MDLLLESGREGVAKELTALIENNAFTGIENLARGSSPGGLLQLLSVGKRLLDHDTLELRLRYDGGMRHPIVLLILGDPPLFTIFLPRIPCLPELVGALESLNREQPHSYFA